MKLIELRAGDKPQPLQIILENHFKKYLKDEDFSQWLKNPVVYVSDRRINKLDFKVKPRAKILFVLGHPKEFESPKIAFESKELVALDKEYGLPTQPTLKMYEDNLFDKVRLHYLLEKNFPGGLPYIGLHHRLDRDTSGLVLMTKQRSANKEVSDLFKNRRINKTYWAYVENKNELLQKKWRYHCKIKRSVSKRHPFIFKVAEVGDEAVTDFEILKNEDSYALVKCSPKTGENPSASCAIGSPRVAHFR